MSVVSVLSHGQLRLHLQVFGGFVTVWITTVLFHSPFNCDLAVSL